MRVEIALADADRKRCDFDEFVVIDVRDCLFQPKTGRRRQHNSVVFAGCPNVCQFLALQRVDLQIIVSAMFADHHALVDFFARTNDGWLTTKVKSRLIANKEIPGTRVKVQTENGVVFLMGLVNRADADKAVAVAQQVYGVQKIVKVFEYLD